MSDKTNFLSDKNTNIILSFRMASGESNSNRPYSLSKDEALARMLQEEEYSAVNHEDEQLARSLQVRQGCN